MTDNRVLLTENFHPLLTEKLSGLGYVCDSRPGITYQEVMDSISSYTGIIVATRIEVDHRLIDAGTNLKFIARAGSGLDRIDVSHARTKGIAVLSSPEGNANAVAEHAVGLLLTMLHNITRSAFETRQGLWLVEKNRVHELEGKTIAIIGYGNTGRAFARKLFPFNMKVLAFDKYLSNYSDDFAMETPMERIYDEAEIVSFHIPLTAETKSMVNHEYMQPFSHPARLINTSRGKIINHRDLLSCIQSGKVIEAACDVYENEDFQNQTKTERMIFDQLVETGKVIFTPHVAGKSFESGAKHAIVLTEKIGMLK